MMSAWGKSAPLGGCLDLADGKKAEVGFVFRFFFFPFLDWAFIRDGGGRGGEFCNGGGWGGDFCNDGGR